jgi:hypothetical protein
MRTGNDLRTVKRDRRGKDRDRRARLKGEKREPGKTFIFLGPHRKLRFLDR